MAKASKTSKTPAKVNPLARAGAQSKALASAVAPMPAFLTEKTVRGMEDLSKYVVLPRLKIVQKSASRDLLDQFRVGSVVVHPLGVMLADIAMRANGQSEETSDSFKFVPLYFFEEWCTHNPVGTQPFIRERTRDPKSELAMKAKDRNRRLETITEGNATIQVRHVEHLNFVCLLYASDNPLCVERTPFILSFYRGSHGGGRQLASLLKARRASPFACVIEAHTSFQQREPHDWYRLDVSNPPDGESPWVTEEEYGDFEKLYTELKAQQLTADYSDGMGEAGEAGGEEDGSPAEM